MAAADSRGLEGPAPLAEARGFHGELADARGTGLSPATTKFLPLWRRSYHCEAHRRVALVVRTLAEVWAARLRPFEAQGQQECLSYWDAGKMPALQGKRKTGNAEPSGLAPAFA